MRGILTRIISLAFFCVLQIFMILHFSCTLSVSAEQKKQPLYEFSAVLIDTESKEPVQSAMIILAHKENEKYECIIDTSLIGTSNQNGEVRIQNLEPGEYVFFYNISGVLHEGLNGKIVKYKRDIEGGFPNDDYIKVISKTLGLITVKKGSQIDIVDGLFSVKSGYLSSADYDLAMLAVEGKLLSFTIPSVESVPIKIEIQK